MNRPLTPDTLVCAIYDHRKNPQRPSSVDFARPKISSFEHRIQNLTATPSKQSPHDSGGIEHNNSTTTHNTSRSFFAAKLRRTQRYSDETIMEKLHQVMEVEAEVAAMKKLNESLSSQRAGSAKATKRSLHSVLDLCNLPNRYPLTTQPWERKSAALRANRIHIPQDTTTTTQVRKVVGVSDRLYKPPKQHVEMSPIPLRCHSADITTTTTTTTPQHKTNPKAFIKRLYADPILHSNKTQHDVAEKWMHGTPDKVIYGDDGMSTTNKFQPFEQKASVQRLYKDEVNKRIKAHEKKLCLYV
eukprot:PhF_6_TR40964/c0_g1_i3/m.62005